MPGADDHATMAVERTTLRGATTMQPFDTVPIPDPEDSADLLSHAGLVDRETATAADVLLWGAEAAAACTVLAVLEVRRAGAASRGAARAA